MIQNQTKEKIKPIVEKKKNQDNSSNNNQVTKKPTVEDDSLKIEESKKEVKKIKLQQLKEKQDLVIDLVFLEMMQAF